MSVVANSMQANAAILLLTMHLDALRIICRHIGQSITQTDPLQTHLKALVHLHLI